MSLKSRQSIEQVPKKVENKEEHNYPYKKGKLILEDKMTNRFEWNILSCKNEEKPPNSDIGLSSNSLHVSEIMAVDENLIGQRYNFGFCWLFSGFLNPYDSPMKCQWLYLNFKWNPQNIEANIHI